MFAIGTRDSLNMFQKIEASTTKGVRLIVPISGSILTIKASRLIYTTFTINDLVSLNTEMTDTTLKSEESFLNFTCRQCMPYSYNVFGIDGEEVVSKWNDSMDISLLPMVHTDFLASVKCFDGTTTRCIHSLLADSYALQSLRLERSYN